MNTLKPFYCFALILLHLSIVAPTTLPPQATSEVPLVRSFGIQGNSFVKDGKPFRYISGSFHYFRSFRDKWGDILHKFKLAGLNVIQTYVEWASHQPTSSEEYNFNGNLNLFAFLEEAARNDLLVILRPGPFIDAERDMGGLPPWLLWQKQGIQLRTSDLDYIYFVTRWFDYLMPRLVPYLYENGGPIIMVQVENEYGSFGCDQNYTLYLRDVLRRNLGSNVTLFTTDGAGESYLKCGSVPGVYPTVDFGPDADMVKAFEIQRKFAVQGPLVNSEFYPGWLDHWGEPHSTSPAEKVAYYLNKMLSFGANVNFYMFYGGTSFGYTAGANLDNGIYKPCPTSYDYDAPLSEAGDPTEKYWKIRQVLAKFVPIPDEKPIVSPKGNYGSIQLKPFSKLFHPQLLSLLDSAPVPSTLPLSFEELKVGSGFVLYETKVEWMTPDPVLLSAPGIKDRGYVYVDHVAVGILSRTQQITSLPIYIRKGGTLSILVENQGRICYGDHIGESKVKVQGLGQVVTLGSSQLEKWKMYRLGELNGIFLERFARKSRGHWATKSQTDTRSSLGSGTFYYGSITIPSLSSNSGSLSDTFVRLDGWTKGVLWVNGFNLGRYWPVVGPQVTLYLPSSLLRPPPATNTFILLELENSPPDCIPIQGNVSNNCKIELTDTHVINGETPHHRNVAQAEIVGRH